MSEATGLLVVDKPGGMTSHDVVARVRRILGTRKVGHAGTLDPMATGVLVLGVGRATRLLGHLALDDKRYVATVRLGATTITDDADGDVVDRADRDVLASLSDARITDAAAAFRGPLEQRPSAVSAVKVDGRRAYARVRAGEQVELAARAVTVTRLDVTGITRPAADAVDVAIDVECSTGTYIRAIARDLGAALGVGGHLVRLQRTRVGPFALDEATSLDALAEDPQRHLIPLGVAAARAFRTWTVDVAEEADVRHGRPITWRGALPADPRPIAILGATGDLLALVTESDGRTRYAMVVAD